MGMEDSLKLHLLDLRKEEMSYMILIGTLTRQSRLVPKNTRENCYGEDRRRATMDTRQASFRLIAVLSASDPHISQERTSTNIPKTDTRESLIMDNQIYTNIIATSRRLGLTKISHDCFFRATINTLLHTLQSFTYPGSHNVCLRGDVSRICVRPSSLYASSSSQSPTLMLTTL